MFNFIKMTKLVSKEVTPLMTYQLLHHLTDYFSHPDRWHPATVSICIALVSSDAEGLPTCIGAQVQTFRRIQLCDRNENRKFSPPPIPLCPSAASSRPPLTPASTALSLHAILPFLEWYGGAGQREPLSPASLH